MMGGRIVSQMRQSGNFTLDDNNPNMQRAETLTNNNWGSVQPMSKIISKT